MPAKIIQKVRALLKVRPPEPPSVDSAQTKGVSPVSAPPAEPATAQTPRKSDGPLPEPLRQIKAVRSGGAQEEWRPSRRREPSQGRRSAPPPGTGPAADGDSGEGSRSPRRRRARKPRNGAGPGPAGTPAADAREAAHANPPSNRPRRNRADAKSESSNGKARREGGQVKRAKGFSFPRPKEEHGNWSREAYTVPEAEGKTRFTELDLADELLHAISDLGYQYATPIQAGILPALLKGQDGLGQAQTGTGKTAAFLLASFTRMLRNPRTDSKNGSPRILIIAPTRELVLQIEEEAAILGKYTPFQTLPVYGGLDFEAQMDALRNHVVDLVVATPGRLIDFLRKKVIHLADVETLVLDEADRMLDMGFIPDVKRIVYATPHKDKRQTLFFSATFTDDVRLLAESWTRNPVSVVIEPENVAADTVDQTVYIITDEQKFPLTVNLLRKLQPARCLIFANRRDSSQYLCDRLRDYEFSTALLTGAVPQAKRVKTLEDFKNGTVPILVATDVAGRGIHVEDVSLVINFNLPEDAEDYVHRIGRTGRAGAEGRSICFADEMDSMLIPDIETYLGRPLVCTHPEEEWLTIEERDRKHHRARSRERAEGGGPRAGGRRGGPRTGGPRGRSGGGGRGRR